MKPFLLVASILLMLCGSALGQKGEVSVETSGAQSTKKLPRPTYPEAARKAGLQGTVPVTVTLDEQGNVTEANASRLHPVCPSVKTPEILEMQRVSLESAKEAKFGKSNSPRTEFIRYIFRLDQKEYVKDQGAFTALGTRLEPAPRTTNETTMKLGEVDGPSRTISGGVLNGKAIELPKPSYPAAARAIIATGAVRVQVLILENGSVYTAEAISGHPLLRYSSEIAACGSRWPPTLLSGKPVKVSGLITYNYEAPK